MPPPLAFLRQKTHPPAYLLTGDEPQLIDELKSAARARYAPEHRHTADLSALQPADHRLGQSQGLFGAAPTLYQLNGAGTPPKAALALIDHLIATIAAPDCLLLVLNELTYKHKKTEWYKKIATRLPVIACDRQPPRQAAEWVAKWCSDQHITLTADAVRLLAIQTAGNLFAAKQTIAKLALQHPPDATSPPPEFTVEDIRATLSDGAKHDIFDIAAAIASGAPARALAILARLRQDGFENAQIQYGIIALINNLSAAQTGGKTTAWGKELDAIRALAARLPPAIMHALTRQAAYADRATKGVATGDPADIQSYIAVQLAARQRGTRIPLPRTLAGDDAWERK